jgi:hypothetical protein
MHSQSLQVRLANEEEFVGVITRVLTQEDRWPLTARRSAAHVLSGVTPRMRMDSKQKQRSLDAVEAFRSMDDADPKADPLGGARASARMCGGSKGWFPSCFVCTNGR